MMAALSHIMRVTAESTVAETQVQVAVRPESNGAAVVIPIRLIDLQEDAFGREIGLIGVGFGNVDFRQNASFGGLLRIVKIEQAIGFELRMKGEGEKAFLILDPRFSIGNIHEQFWIPGGGIARK